MSRCQRRMRQVLMTFLRCSASLKSGVRCHYAAKYGEFCGHHRRLPSVLKANFNPVGRNYPEET